TASNTASTREAAPATPAHHRNAFADTTRDYRTVVGNECPGNSCSTVIPHYSNPDVDHYSLPGYASVVTGDAATADAARAFEDTDTVVAGWRTTGSAPPTPSLDTSCVGPGPPFSPTVTWYVHANEGLGAATYKWWQLVGSGWPPMYFLSTETSTKTKSFTVSAGITYRVQACNAWGCSSMSSSVYLPGQCPS
ncbi:MAG: hypothetical protein K0V04_19085, partial [Deltaproteobacteria bacterium]|nr:hypothetical protein [Deltaproteobacteria bacterium]